MENIYLRDDLNWRDEANDLPDGWWAQPDEVREDYVRRRWPQAICAANGRSGTNAKVMWIMAKPPDKK